MRAMRLPDVRAFAREHAMPVVAVCAALVTCAFVPPDAAYASYEDWGTLAKLAAMLLAVGGLRASGALQALAVRVVRTCAGVRTLTFALVGATAVASMFVTNDMALLALLPLAAACLHAAGRLDLLAPLFVVQGIAANLCGMLLPFGNPQNIYLTGAFGIGFAEFARVMLPPFLLSCVLVALGCALAGSGPVRVSVGAQPVRVRQALTSALALLACVAAVLGAVPAWCALVVVVALTLVGDAHLLVRMDWGLVVTFAAFFVFSGNLARVDAVRAALAGWLAAGAFVPAALLSQVISNVPAAIVLSRFTADWPGLLAGVNVGGAGTPVASLATLIVIAQYGVAARGLAAGRVPASADGAPHAPWPARRFTALLLGANVLCLAVLLVAGLALGW